MKIARSKHLILMALTLAAVLLNGCARKETGPNVLLISIDTTRADHCSLNGYERDTTPNLKKLATEGTRFAQVYAPTSTTGPSHATLFTSLYPLTHRVIKNGLTLSEEYETLAELLRARGYATAAFVSSFALNDKFGFAQGFESFDDCFDPKGASAEIGVWKGYEVQGGFDRRADATTDRVLDWLEKRKSAETPCFMWVHYFDPHAPYTPPAPFDALYGNGTDREAWSREQRITNDYDGEITLVDHEIGRLLETLKILDMEKNTVVMVTADHGEGLLQHGFVGHGVHLYEEAVRIPLVVRWPGRVRAGHTLEEPVGLIDLAPTLMDLIGEEVKTLPFQGTSFAGALLGRSSLDPQRPIFLYRRQYDGGLVEGIPVIGEKFGVRMGPWKYIEGKEERTFELYDLNKDSAERENLFEKSPEQARKLKKIVEAWKKSYTSDKAVQDNQTDEDIEKLRQMGYIK
ncbi:MAG: sulfatase-like hydrolase/transferase [Planctomycetes bacterium]|nr:sulfatase-like hydrolase/transferase [Planctomycetota bacterium]